MKTLVLKRNICQRLLRSRQQSAGRSVLFNILTHTAVLLLMLALGTRVQATEAAQIQNYDRWKDLPNKTLIDKGDEYWRANKVDSALVCFTIVSNRYNSKMSQKEKEICFRAAISIGNLYEYDLYNYQMAYVYLSKAEKIATESNLKSQLVNIKAAKVDLESIKQDFKCDYAYQEETLKETQRLFHQSVECKNNKVACLSLLNLVYYAMKHHHVDDIEPELQLFGTLDIPATTQYKQFLDRLCVGIEAYRGKKYQEALEVFTQLQNFQGQTESPQRIACEAFMLCVYRHVTWLALHNDTEALKELDKAEGIARDNQINEGISEILRMKQEYHLAHGNEALAKEYELEYFKSKDAFINRSTLLNAEQQKFLIDIDEMNQEMADLAAQKRVRDIVLTGVALLALLVIGVLIYVWRNYRTTQERNVLLFQRVQQLLAQEEQWRAKEHGSKATADAGPTSASTPAKKYRNNPLDEQDKDQLMQRIYAVIESHDEVYAEGFTLDQLAKLIGANPNYVSQVINERTEGNFSTFINEYKIKEACRRLSDLENYSGYTIEAIGRSVGFRSRANFTTTFKKFTGMTPTAYQHMAKEGTSAPAQAQNFEQQ